MGPNSRICFINVCAVLKLNDAFIRFTPLGYKRTFWVQKLVLPLLYKGITTSNPRSTLVRLKTKGNRPMLADQSIPYRNFARGPLGGGPLLKTSGIKELLGDLSGIKESKV